MQPSPMTASWSLYKVRTPSGGQNQRGRCLGMKTIFVFFGFSGGSFTSLMKAFQRRLLVPSDVYEG